tara:strand:+ start:166 stop:390 length:225 start_codon:yes stop_codon:yes gene_type:complete
MKTFKMKTPTGDIRRRIPENMVEWYKSEKGWELLEEKTSVKKQKKTETKTEDSVEQTEDLTNLNLEGAEDGNSK